MQYKMHAIWHTFSLAHNKMTPQQNITQQHVAYFMCSKLHARQFVMGQIDCALDCLYVKLCVLSCCVKSYCVLSCCMPNWLRAIVLYVIDALPIYIKYRVLSKFFWILGKSNYCYFEISITLIRTRTREIHLSA